MGAKLVDQRRKKRKQKKGKKVSNEFIPQYQ